ncbi:hypothetical protein, partial [Mediterraneibacter gnavus]
DISLLNEAREKLENMIYCFCKCYGLTGGILELAGSTAPKQGNPFGESGELPWLIISLYFSITIAKLYLV